MNPAAPHARNPFHFFTGGLWTVSSYHETYEKARDERQRLKDYATERGHEVIDVDHVDA